MYCNEVIGINSRLDELQAVVLMVKLNHLEKWNDERPRLAHLYDKNLATVEKVIIRKVCYSATSVYHVYNIRSWERNRLQTYLKDKGIATLIHFPIPPHLQEAYKHLGYQKGDFPIAEEIASTCLSLPIYPGLKNEMVEYICNAIKAFFLIGI